MMRAYNTNAYKVVPFILAAEEYVNTISWIPKDIELELWKSFVYFVGTCALLILSFLHTFQSALYATDSQ